MAKESEAEIYLQVMQRLWPSIYRSRIKTLDHMLCGVGTGYKWYNGRLEVSPSLYTDLIKSHSYEKMNKLYRAGKAPSVQDLYLKYRKKHAQEYISKFKNTRTKDDTVENIVAKFIELDKEHDEVGHTFYVSKEYSPICNIPDDISLDWLCLCLETIKMMGEAKIDYDENSILTKSDKEMRLKLKEVNREQISKDITKRILGDDYKERTDEEKKKDREEWEKHHSPKARAERANYENQKARDIAKNILNDLRKRKILQD